MPRVLILGKKYLNATDLKTEDHVRALQGQCHSFMCSFNHTVSGFGEIKQ